MHHLLTKFTLRLPYSVQSPFPVALRSPFRPASACCTLTVSSSLISKYPFLLTLPQRFIGYLITRKIALIRFRVNSISCVFSQMHTFSSPYIFLTVYASIRSVMLYRLIPMVERLCSVADVAGVMTPIAPRTMSMVLNDRITL